MKAPQIRIQDLIDQTIMDYSAALFRKTAKDVQEAAFLVVREQALRDALACFREDPPKEPAA